MPNASDTLGRLRRVEVRSVWGSEAGHFTPWLAGEDNLRLLGETIGIELEFEAQEKDVGPFRADILCKDTATGDWVLIENQLERTDHTHLGQLITYAAGLKAVTIVWVANPFTEEHRAAVDWLNEITDTRFNFFGLEIELWRIGDSPVAPKFNIISKPNDWSRSVTEGKSRSELTESQALRVRFWTAFRDYVADRETPIRPTKPLPQNWMAMGIGRSGFNLSAIASLYDSEAENYDSNEVRAEVVITDERSKDYFALLEAEKEEIEAELDYALAWHNPEDYRMSKVYVRRSADLAAEETWPELHGWLLERLEELRAVFAPRIQDLTLPAAETVTT